MSKRVLFAPSQPKRDVKKPNLNNTKKIDASTIKINIEEHTTEQYPKRDHFKTFDESQEVLSIDSLQFTFMSDEEILKLSVTECNKPSATTAEPNTTYDPMMGPINARDSCKYCNEKWIDCPGHFGHISLHHPIPHPLKIKTILQYLNIFCSHCYRLVLSEEHFKLYDIHKYPGNKRFEKITQEVEKFSTCSHCEKIVFKYGFEEDKFIRKYKKEKITISVKQIQQIFSNIAVQDIELIGFDSKFVHPKMLLFTKLPVIPPCSRSYCVRGEGQIGHDDLTQKYNEIIRLNNCYAKETNEKIQQQYIANIMQNVLLLMDSDKVKSKNNEKVQVKSIKQRISGKTGQVRNNLLGKRLDFCGRTVITPEPNCSVDELIVPEKIAKTLTIPVTVTEKNLQECQKMLYEDKINMILRKDQHNPSSERQKIHVKYYIWSEGTELQENDIVVRNSIHINPTKYELLKKRKFELKDGDQIIRDGKLLDKIKIEKRIENKKVQVGDIVERQIRDGDWTLFNRQPTLHKGSMRAKKIKILPKKTFRFNLASTQAYNADFDGKFLCFILFILFMIINFLFYVEIGDEMNMFLPQSYTTIAECKEIVSTKANFTSAQDSKPLLAIKQDAMTGGYILTLKQLHIDKNVFQNVLSLPYFPIEWIIEKTQHIYNVFEKLGMIKDDNFDELYYTGHTLFSFLLPNDFEYECDNQTGNKPVLIHQGVLLQGILNKQALGSESGSMIHHLYKDYGADRAAEFVSNYQILINFWFQHNGFSIGLEDCIPENSDEVNNVINKCFLEAAGILQTETHPIVLEDKLSDALNQAVTQGQKIAHDALRPDNSLVQVILSGAKGNFANVAQVTALVGQQNVSAQRIPKSYGGRTLPHFPMNDTLKNPCDINELGRLFISRGFVKSSFFQGLNVYEFFFHAAGGREGLIDTAIKTAQTGYIQRKLIKMMEDLKVSYTNSIVNSNNQVIEFMYGHDLLDAGKMIKTKQGFSFIDIKHISDKINMKHWFNVQSSNQKNEDDEMTILE